MENTLQFNPATLPQVLKNPAPRSIAEVKINKPDRITLTIYASEMYWRGNEIALSLFMDKLLKKNLDYDLKDLLSDMIKDFPSDWPTSLLAKSVQFIVARWEKIKQPAPLEFA